MTPAKLNGFLSTASLHSPLTTPGLLLMLWKKLIPETEKKYFFHLVFCTMKDNTFAGF